MTQPVYHEPRDPVHAPDAPEHERARHWRESMGLSRQQLGEAIGYHRNTIANIEAGRSPDRMRTYRLACAAVAAGLAFDWRALRFEVERATIICGDGPAR